MITNSRQFAQQTGYEDGQNGRPRTTGWQGEDAEAYEAGYAHGTETADIVGGVFGVCHIRENPETGERTVEYFPQPEPPPAPVAATKKRGWRKPPAWR